MKSFLEIPDIAVSSKKKKKKKYSITENELEKI